jgi:tRNA1Val (adenine37-N6)-methyltransferase
MKVCTDACILGAWTAEMIEQTELHPGNILDIGCGTGLLSLMLAQKTSAAISAIEIDANAAAQAKENISQSPWKEQITLFNLPIQRFTNPHKYDLIICNPPFFEDDLKSPDETKNNSKHDTALKLDELVFYMKQHMNKNGSAVILLPFHRTDYFSSLLRTNNLFIKESLFLKQSPGHSYFRSIILLSNENVQPIESNELTIHDEHREYTKEFKKLLKDYYLKL